MARFKYTELNFASDQMDDDIQRVDVLWINLVLVKSLDACNMSVFCFKGEFMGFSWKKPVLVPPSALSRKLGCERNRLLSY